VTIEDHGVTKNVLEVIEALAESLPGTHALWRYLLDVDRVARPRGDPRGGHGASGPTATVVSGDPLRLPV
jgi:hypothetical protein